MRPRVRVSPVAFMQIDEADTWWRENRTANPDLFMTELRAGLEHIERFSTVFAELDEPRFPGLRRLLLQRSRYYVYWVTTADAVEVLAVWHASRGRGPLEPRR